MNSENLSAFLFINFEQALGFGHIAWGFEIEPGRYFFGSTDHLLKRPMWDLLALLKYSSVKPGDDIDYWSAQGSFEDMLDEMLNGHHIRYHSYKQLIVPVAEAAPLLAKEAAEKLRHEGWTLWDNNCVHQTYRLLKIFGAGHAMKEPFQAPVPVHFFEQARGDAFELSRAQVISRSGS
jgi:hypothetical protein